MFRGKNSKKNYASTVFWVAIFLCCLLKAKYETATQHSDHVRIVSPDWIHDVLEQGRSSLDENLYHPRLLLSVSQKISAAAAATTDAESSDVTEAQAGADSSETSEAAAAVTTPTTTAAKKDDSKQRSKEAILAMASSRYVQLFIVLNQLECVLDICEVGRLITVSSTAWCPLCSCTTVGD